MIYSPYLPPGVSEERMDREIDDDVDVRELYDIEEDDDLS